MRDEISSLFVKWHYSLHTEHLLTSLCCSQWWWGRATLPSHAVSPGIRTWGRLWLRQLLVLLLHLVPAFHHPPNVQFCFSVLVQWLKLHVCAHKCVYEQKQWQRHCHVSLVVLFTARYRISFSSFFFPPKLNCSNYSFRLTLGARRIATW